MKIEPYFRDLKNNDGIKRLMNQGQSYVEKAFTLFWLVYMAVLLVSEKPRDRLYGQLYQTETALSEEGNHSSSVSLKKAISVEFTLVYVSFYARSDHCYQANGAQSMTALCGLLPPLCNSLSQPVIEF